MRRLSLALAFVGLVGLGCRTAHERTRPPMPAAPSEGDILAGSDLPATLAEPLPGDPLAVTIHRLSNGMTVYLSPVHEQPRVQAWIAVRAGARHDPPHATGLAHYLEHMILFKGSDDLGTVDHAAEAPHLAKTRELYRALAEAKGDDARAEVMGQLADVTRTVAKTTIPNEKTRLFDQLGFVGTNAFTNTERTHYLTYVPANRVGQWAEIEAEQLADPTFRLFFAELEAVYEEKNQALDRPDEREFKQMRRLLFPEHRYGADVLGAPEHLTTPDFDAMVEFFERWYVPNNMAIILAGDVDETILPTLERHFGRLEPRALERDDRDRVVPLHGRVAGVVQAPGEGAVTLAWPTVAVHHADAPALEMLDALLDDPRVGVLAQDLVRPGKLAWARSWFEHFAEAGYHAVSAPVRDDTDHATIEATLRAAVGRLRETEVDAATLDAIKLRVVSQRMYEAERPVSRAARILDAFIRHQQWPDALAAAKRFETVTPAELRAVAQRYFGEDFVVVHRVPGGVTDPLLRKPTVTDLAFAKAERSAFATRIADAEVRPIEPRFIEVGRDVERIPTAFGEVTAATNRRNELFTVVIELDRGFRDDPLLCHALAAWNGAGAPGLDPDALQQRLFELGAAVSTSCDAARTRIELFGIDRGDRFDAAVALLQAWLAKPTIDPTRLAELTKTTLSARAASLDDDSAIFDALLDFAYFGDESPERRLATDRALQRATPKDLVRSIAALTRLRHHVSYFGPRRGSDVAPRLKFGPGDRDAGRGWVRRYRKVLRPEIHIVHRSSAKATIHAVIARAALEPSQLGAVAVATAHLQATSFAELRVRRSLAYLVDAGIDLGRVGDDAARWGIVACQPDKTDAAVRGLLDVLGGTPDDEARVRAVDRVTESRRTLRVDARAIAQSTTGWRERGVALDPAQLTWSQLPSVDAAAIESLAGDTAPLVAIVGDTHRIDMEALRAIGAVIVHEPAELFSYGDGQRPQPTR